ncbi:hypothetical protein [Legionella sp. km772]|uniref:hypothetical protein n=1 Tax=Legionella sp. km772 TaxID=2498111 RepID=UPI000F8C6BBE|nr:hypothetical protein [Legionella sp. km772]RUR04723.1 hypothetical protein ELY15_15155 [Legionella sp. km772]
MKKIMLISLFLSSFSLFAVSATDLTKNWICTTNASSSDVAADKAADDQMKNTKGTADASFKFAAEHCRDCTKITCEVND